MARMAKETSQELPMQHTGGKASRQCTLYTRTYTRARPFTRQILCCLCQFMRRSREATCHSSGTARYATQNGLQQPVAILGVAHCEEDEGHS
mmetsp:Transcript_69811/g.177155  ORF Transcript_69811/g.177155 Transcript_69811/m.177155 type:complete len:92 (+) Transcript_69811:450-725(+)